MLRPFRASFFLAIVALSPLVACSTFDPHVGRLQNDGAAVATCSLGASGYGTTYGSPAGGAATADFCTADGGTLAGPCDTCEAASCCPTRVACYSDQSCSCADTALDACITAVPDASATSSLLACWTAFGATNVIAEARYACLTKLCSTACQIPSGT
jgi:hypothetical protein